jgi:hypothetical protein
MGSRASYARVIEAVRGWDLSEQYAQEGKRGKVQARMKLYIYMSNDMSYSPGVLVVESGVRFYRAHHDLLRLLEEAPAG